MKKNLFILVIITLLNTVANAQIIRENKEK